MNKVKIKAITSFSHGPVDATAGGTYSVNKGDAQELEKAGMAQIVTEGDDAAGEKTAPTLENKMAPAPDNKADEIVARQMAKQAEAAEKEGQEPADVGGEAPEENSKSAAGKAAPRKTTAGK